MPGRIGFIGQRVGRGIGKLSPSKGVPALAWRYPNNAPVLKQGGGYWMRAS